MNRLTATLHEVFHEPSSPLYRRVELFIWLLIVASIALFVVDVAQGPDAARAGWLDIVDRVILGLFAVEVTLRILTFRPPTVDFFDAGPLRTARYHVAGRLRFMLRPMTVVDLLTVLAVVPALRGLRALRLLRLLRTSNVFRYSNPFASIARAFEENGLLFGFGFSLFGAVVILGGLSIFLVERGANPAISSLSDGIWWAVVTLTTVGFGDITPATGLGRIVGGILMVAGMFTLALFAGIVGQSLLHSVLTIREEQFRMMSYVDHIVLCGYEPGARMLLDRLALELDLQAATVVVFAPGERPADLPPEFLWIGGDPTKESELEKVRMAHARAVVLVGSRSQLPQQADATTILTAFTIRRYVKNHPAEQPRKRPLYVIAEILDAENVEHAYAAGADEVIETNRIGFSLVAHAVHMPGTAVVMSELADVAGHGLYVADLPGEWEMPLPFAEVARRLRAERRVMVVGIQDADTGRHELDPADDHPVDRDDRLIYLSKGPLEG